jgi:hypothetical protein
MSVSPVGGPTDWSAVASVNQQNNGARMQSVVSSVSKLFGMSTDDLKSQLASGQSLSQIAVTKGVSQANLLSAIKTGLQTAASGTQQSGTTTSGLDAQATRIANRKHHHHHGGGAGAAAATSAATSTTGSALAVQSTDQTAQFSAAALFGQAPNQQL